MPPNRNSPLKRGFTFYAVVDSGVLHDRKLALPIEFIRNFGSDLSDVAVLQVPTGKQWAVEVVKAGNGGAYLCSGWHEFVKYYCVTLWQLMTFTYEGSCRFGVRILDNRSRCEIDYELNYVGGGGGGGVFFTPEKVASNVLLKVAKVDSTTASGEGKKSRKDEAAAQAADKLNLQHPFFVVVMRPSYVHYGHPSIPQSFAKKHFTEKVDSVTLMVPDGRIWKVGCSGGNKNYYILRKGWRDFQNKMGLKEGNVCVFELTRRTNVELKVHILPNA